MLRIMQSAKRPTTLFAHSSCTWSMCFFARFPLFKCLQECASPAPTAALLYVSYNSAKLDKIPGMRFTQRANRSMAFESALVMHVIHLSFTWSIYRHARDPFISFAFFSSNACREWTSPAPTVPHITTPHSTEIPGSCSRSYSNSSSWSSSSSSSSSSWT